LNSDPAKTVAAGYDAIARTYLDWTAASTLRQHWRAAITPVTFPVLSDQF
jgi:hypothetical protein